MSFFSVLSDFQATMGASIVGSGGDENLVMHCLGSFIRAFILLGGFMVGQHFLGVWHARPSKPAPSSPGRKVGASIGRQRIPVKRVAKAMSDDEDAASTSAGSSDDASDILSSDEEEVQSVQAGRISKADLLSFRPAPGSAPAGGLRAMRADHRTKPSQLPEQRSWESIRSSGTQKSMALPVSGAPKVQARAAPTPKSSRKVAPAPKLPINADGDVATPGLLTASRVEALLSICCPDTPVTLSMALGTDEAKAKEDDGKVKVEGSSQVPPPWRKRSA